LELLLEEQVTVIALGANLGVIVHFILLLRFFIERGRTEGNWSFGDIAEILKNSMNAIGASSAHSKPVLNTMLVDNHRSLHSGRFPGEPETDTLEVASSGVLACRLHHNPPIVSLRF
jgi:hypothetical protein